MTNRPRKRASDADVHESGSVEAGPRRAQGRPPRADAEATRARMIAAARELLHHTKPARITRHDIARAAGVDPALVRYYFGDKSAVFAEVIRVVTTELSDKRAALPTSGPVVDRLCAYLAVWLETFSANPHYHELVVEQVFYAESADGEARLERFVERAFPQLAALYAEGVASGELRAEEPRFVYLSVIALSEFFATAAPLVEVLFGRRGRAKRLRERYREFASRLLLDGLRQRG